MHIAIRILLLVATIGVLVGAYILFGIIRKQGCVEHPLTWEELTTGLNSDYVFVSNQHRSMAEIIYEYRKSKEYLKTDLGYRIIFTTIDPKAKVPSANNLRDVVLHKLITCDQAAFNKYVLYIPFFNHPRYVECLKAYNATEKVFAIGARDIILNEILKINPTLISGTDSSFNGVAQALQTQIPNYSDADLYKLLTNGLP